jgi:acetyl esterase/lipase
MSSNLSLVFRSGCAAALGGLALAAAAQTAGASAAPLPLDPRIGISTVRLWDGPAPGAKGDRPEDIPTLTVFLPPPRTANGTAIVINPGGAYLGLAMNLEGREVASWFNVRGVTAFVLRYRLGPRYLYPVPLEDAERAVRWVRFHAREYHLSPDRIGMAGFSAGGHLAAMVGTIGGPGNPEAADPIDRLNSRPNFLVLGYPWLNAMEEPSPRPFIAPYEQLMKLPESEARGLAEKYTPTFHVTAETPPTFIYTTTTDRTVPVSASLDFYAALVAHGVPAELHAFGHGGHGSGLGKSDPDLDLWPVFLEPWLRNEGLLPPPPRYRRK